MIQLLSILCAFATLTAASSLNNADQACVNSYSDPLDNDYLVGTWYDVYKFAIFLNLMPSSSCVKTVITKPTQSEVQKYIDAYKLDNPYSFNDNPILMDRFSEYFVGMLMGNNEAKFYVYDPDTVFFQEDRYEARVYKKVNDDYMLFHQCSLNGNQKWLMSRKNTTTNEELDEVLKLIQSEVRDLQTQRYCA